MVYHPEADYSRGMRARDLDTAIIIGPGSALKQSRLVGDPHGGPKRFDQGIRR